MYGLLISIMTILMVILGCQGCGIKPPGSSFSGTLPGLTAGQEQMRDRLQADVEHLASVIGPRHARVGPAWNDGRSGTGMDTTSLDVTAEWIEARLKAMGHNPGREVFPDDAGTEFSNIVLTLRGASAPEEIVVIGAHYDTVPESPGADDNASGVAGLLAIAHQWVDRSPGRTLRLVFFTNEEQPWSKGPLSGSVVHARKAADRGENIVGMISLEMLGFYRDERGSQQLPFPYSLLYPKTADYIAFVGNSSSRAFLVDCVGFFRESVAFPSEGAAAPDSMEDAGRSDHWAFWQHGWPAFMITDTANYRNDHYHQASDTADTLDYDRMARVVFGILGVVDRLVSCHDSSSLDDSPDS